MGTRNTPVAMTSAGFQVLSLANSTALPLNSTLGTGKWFHVTVETNSCRYRADGTLPAKSTGILLATGTHWLPEMPGSLLGFQRTTGISKVSVQAFKYD